MSEKTLVELICDLRRQLPGSSGYHSWAAMFDARIRRAEAAEAFASLVAGHSPGDLTPDEYANGEQLLREYMAAREAVRKLEEQDKGGKG